MARMPAVINLLKHLDGRADGPDWEIFARELRRGSVLPESRRGLGAASVTIPDAVNLLLVGMATDSPSRGPDIAVTYRAMHREGELGECPAWLAPSISHKTFGSVLESLIYNAGLVEAASGRLLIRVRSPFPRATIEWYRPGNDAFGRPDYQISWLGQPTNAKIYLPGEQDYPVPPRADLQVTREAIITHHTIIALADVLAE